MLTAVRSLCRPRASSASMASIFSRIFFERLARSPATIRPPAIHGARPSTARRCPSSPPSTSQSASADRASDIDRGVRRLQRSSPLVFPCRAEPTRPPDRREGMEWPAPVRPGKSPISSRSPGLARDTVIESTFEVGRRLPPLHEPGRQRPRTERLAFPIWPTYRAILPVLWRHPEPAFQQLFQLVMVITVRQCCAWQGSRKHGNLST